MAFVDYSAGLVRDYVTTLTDYLAIGTTTTETISVTSTTINAVITTINKVAITYPSSKKYTVEYLLPSTAANGYTLRRIGTKANDTTTNVITISDVPSLDKNALIEISYNYTIEVVNT